MLADFFAHNGMERVVCVSHAKVPIVKMWDPELEVACDMNVNNTMALENTRMIRTYVEIDERVRILAMVVKYWTKRRSLNDAALGGTLSSYTWICMCINFLQTRDPPILPSLQKRPHEDQTTADGKPADFDSDMDTLKGFSASNTSSIGQLLFGFFRYYGYEYDYETSVISVREGRVLRKPDKGWHLLQNNRLCVEEPFNTSRNLGNTADDCSFKGLHMEIRRAFNSLCHADLEEACELYIPPPEEETRRLESQSMFERPTQQARMTIQPIPPHRGGRGGRRGNGNGRGGARRPSTQSPRPAGQNGQSGLNGPGSGPRQNPSALSAEMQAAQVQAQVQVQAQAQAAYIQDHLYQQIQLLQAHEEMRLNGQQGQARSPNTNQAADISAATNALLSSPTAWVSYPFAGQPQAPHQPHPSSTQGTSNDQRSETNSTQQSFPGTPMRSRQQHMIPLYYPASYGYLTTPTNALNAAQQLHPSSTNPPSPSMKVSGTSTSQEQDQAQDVRSGRPVVAGKTSALRASSQPARSSANDGASSQKGNTGVRRFGLTPISSLGPSQKLSEDSSLSSSPTKKSAAPYRSPIPSNVSDVFSPSQSGSVNEGDANTPTMAYAQPSMYTGELQHMGISPMEYLQHYVNLNNSHAHAAAFGSYHQYQSIAQMHGYMPGTTMPIASGTSAPYQYMTHMGMTSPQHTQATPADASNSTDLSETSSTPRSVPGKTGVKPRSHSQQDFRGPLIVDGSSPVVDRRQSAARDDSIHGYAKSLPGAFTPLAVLPAEDGSFDPSSLHQNSSQSHGYPLSQSLPNQVRAPIAAVPLYGYQSDMSIPAAQVPQALPYNAVPWAIVNNMPGEEQLPGPETLAERLRRFQVQDSCSQSGSASSHGGEHDSEKDYETQDEIPPAASSPEVFPEDDITTSVIAPTLSQTPKATEALKDKATLPSIPQGRVETQTQSKSPVQKEQNAPQQTEPHGSPAIAPSAVQAKANDKQTEKDVPPWRRKTSDSPSSGKPVTRPNSKSTHHHHSQKSKDGHEKEKSDSSHASHRRGRGASTPGHSSAASASHSHAHSASGGWQTTTSKKKGRKHTTSKSNAASSISASGGPEPMPAEESLRKGG